VGADVVGLEHAAAVRFAADIAPALDSHVSVGIQNGGGGGGAHGAIGVGLRIPASYTEAGAAGSVSSTFDSGSAAAQQAEAAG